MTLWGGAGRKGTDLSVVSIDTGLESAKAGIVEQMWLSAERWGFFPLSSWPLVFSHEAGQVVGWLSFLLAEPGKT